MAVNVFVTPKRPASGPFTLRLACMENSKMNAMIYPPEDFRSIQTQVFVSLLPPKTFWVNHKEQICI